MQMSFVIYTWQIIEYLLQICYCIIIVCSYHQAKAIIAMLITKLLSSINMFAEVLCDIMPIHWNKYGHK